MLTRITNRKLIAGFCLTVFSISTFTPTVSYALTSGPAQPEMQGFTPAGTNDMVDAFTGDFSYNIPLMDVGGYPLNISYRSGASIDDEASWVGYGWSLTPGVVNRQMRGLPDDFKGDRIKKSSYAKPNRTFGLTADAKVKLKGFKIDKPKASLNTRIGIRYNNYTGIGASMGASASLSLTDNAADPRTVDMGIKTDNQSGATLDFSSNFLTMIEGKDKAQRSSSLGSPVGFSFSANAGVENLTLSASYGKRKKPEEERNYVNVRSISFLGNAYTPQVRPFNSSFSGSFKVSLGAKIFPFLIAAGFTGSYSTSGIPKDKITTATRSYGFLYNTDAKSRPDALMDFNRENDIPFNKKIPNLPVPIYTPDLFNVSSQGGGGQYRLYAGGSGVLADNFQADNSFSISTGIELGFGTGSHVGANLPPSFNNTINTSGKWVDKNNFLPNGDFKNKTLTEPALQPVYFKKVGEGTISDNGFYNTIGQQQAVRVGLDNSFNAKIFGSGKSSHAILNNRNVPVSTAALTKTVNEKRNSVFSYLTAVEAGKYGLNASILSYTPNSLSQCFTANGVSYPRYVEMPETDELYPSVPKKHHISEITITEPGGGRQVFGVPVYNVFQEEVSFSVVKNTTAQNNGYINYPAGHSVVSIADGIVKSTEYHYHYNSQIIPAYTTAYLLSGILSPDYVDITNNGITDDDLGTAVRFNYSKMPYLYKWRTPHAPKSANQVNVANYNEGLLSDKKDDKATFSYGEKELWYSHSIESKTMVALFILNNPENEARKDGLGVLNRDGGIDAANRLRYLKQIKLFSKADIVKYGVNNAVPVKTVHFEYNYEIFRGNEGLPNSEGVNGKLTLKKIWFTFGNNGKGILSPYEFSYNLPDGNDIHHNNYVLKQYDRWGNYKPNNVNPGNLRNAEYPYSVQDTALANKYARYWNLSTIVMPTGGILRVNYESDDYAYVQDKRAATMMPITGVGTNGNAVNITNHNKIFVTLPNPSGLSSTQLKMMYFEGIEYLYFKCYVDLDNRGNYEYVPGYGKIQQININGNIAEIEIEKIKNNNPISTASWQLLKTSLPRLAYPGYDNMDNVGDNFKKIVAALASALGRLPELIKTFDAVAKGKGYSSKIDLSRSWVRINSPMYKKIGGGNRVSSLTIADDWKAMTANANAPAGEYGQRYVYTTEKQLTGSSTPLVISSGVASYEPILGADENPFRQPVMYSTKNFLGPSTTNYIERPLGETFFQAPSVGYSKIRVINIGATPNSDGKTGSVETEFYTAKDFPVLVSETPIETIRPALGFLFRFFAVGITEHLTTSQGYAVINNNMHGKIKSEKIFAKNGQEIASTHYEYNLKNQNSASPELNNTVNVLTENGTVQSALMGVDADIFHDMRQVSTDNMGAAGEPSVALGPPFTGSNYFNWGWYLPNYERRMFRSTVSIKTIYQFGILKKVTKKINGSTIETENLLWDAETGDVLLTKTQNEFDKPIFSFTYPAHWAYKGMGSAYKNQGLYLYNFNTTNAEPNGYTSLLSEGDELVNVSDNQSQHYWVVDNPNGSSPFKIINSEGQNVDISNATIKVLRSGYRNMSASPIGTIVSLENPIQNNQLNISVNSKILDAKSLEYNDDWWMPINYPNSLSYFTVLPEPITSHATMNNVSMAISEGDGVGNTGYIYNCINTEFVAMKGHTANNTVHYSASSTGFANVPIPPNAKIISAKLSLYATPSPILGSSPMVGNNKSYLYRRKTDAGNCTYYGLTTHTNIDYDNSVILAASTNSTQDYENIDITNMYKAWYNKKDASAFAVAIKNEVDTWPKPQPDGIPESNIDFVSMSFCGAGHSNVGKRPKLEIIYSVCDNPENKTFNPYRHGVKGNWRALKNYVYNTNRVSPSTATPTDNISNNGHYSAFSPFWAVSGTILQKNSAQGTSNWQWATTSTFFGTNGQELENVDALNRHSSALFGYLKSMPVAVASNAQQREIMNDGFEDYNLNLNCSLTDCNAYTGHFDFKEAIANSNEKISITDNGIAHSGKRSLQLNDSLVVERDIISKPNSIYTRNGIAEYVLFSNYMLKGFMPLPNKQYILSFWLKDLQPNQLSTNFRVKVNDIELISSTAKWPMVEGWKRVEVEFNAGSDAITKFRFKMLPSGLTHIDDIRIFPKDAQLKSFVYHPSSLRLMAELDENNFATFYEYDDEGTLIRVKKETEKGIATIKETRSSNRKKQ